MPRRCCTAISSAPAPVRSDRRIGETCVRSEATAEGDRKVPQSASPPEREGRSGDAAEREPTGETRFVQRGRYD